MQLNDMTQDELIDQLLLFVCPSRQVTPAFRDDQKRILNMIADALGSELYQKQLRSWMQSHQRTEMTFEDFTKDKSYVARVGKNGSFHHNEKYKTDDPTFKFVALPKEGKITVWEAIYKDLYRIKTDKVELIDSELYPMLIRQFPDYVEYNRANLLKYMASTFTIPLVLGTEDYGNGLRLMREICRKAYRLSDSCVLSPHMIDQEMCPNGFWEDFPSWAPDDEQKKFLRQERLITVVPRLGLFGLDNREENPAYHPDFQRLLKHYVYNHKLIILMDKTLTVLPNHWLITLLRRSITLDLDDQTERG